MTILEFESVAANMKLAKRFLRGLQLLGVPPAAIKIEAGGTWDTVDSDNCFLTSDYAKVTNLGRKHVVAVVDNHLEVLHWRPESYLVISTKS